MAILQTDAKQAIEQQEAKFVQAVNSRQGVKEMIHSYYHSEARFLPNHGPEAKGHNAIHKSIQGMIDQGFSNLKTNTVTIETEGEIAWAIGHYTMDIPPIGGATAIKDTGKYVSVWRHQPDGKYQCIADMFNSDLPPTGIA